MYAVATPDHDVYLEDLSGDSGDITAARYADGRRDLPRGIPWTRVYRFRANPTAAQWARYREEAG